MPVHHQKETSADECLSQKSVTLQICAGRVLVFDVGNLDGR